VRCAASSRPSSAACSRSLRSVSARTRSISARSRCPSAALAAAWARAAAASARAAAVSLLASRGPGSEAYAALTLVGPDALELLARAPDPESAARLTVTQITAALKRAGRRGDLAQRARDIQAALRTPHLTQPAVITEAYAAAVMAAAAVITILNEQAKIMEAKVSGLFHRHPDAGTYLSQPGIGDITGARVLGEFGDAPGRYATAKARKNYAGTSPLTIASGKSKAVHARYIRNRHLISPLHAQALSALTASPGARAFYDELRAREVGHDDALRRVASRLTGILHGCLKHGTGYDEATAWAHRAGLPKAA
jgi:hypothetical protein